MYKLRTVEWWLLGAGNGGNGKFWLKGTTSSCKINKFWATNVQKGEYLLKILLYTYRLLRKALSCLTNKKKIIIM